MKAKILITINVLMAVGSAIFIWDMLPYAHGVACEVSKNCGKLSLFVHSAFTVTPLLIVLALLFGYSQMREKYSKSATALLLIFPIITIGLFINVAVKP